MVWGMVVVVVARAGMKVLCRRVFHGEGRRGDEGINDDDDDKGKFSLVEVGKG